MLSLKPVAFLNLLSLLYDFPSFKIIFENPEKWLNISWSLPNVSLFFERTIILRCSLIKSNFVYHKNLLTTSWQSTNKKVLITRNLPLGFLAVNSCGFIATPKWIACNKQHKKADIKHFATLWQNSREDRALAFLINFFLLALQNELIIEKDVQKLIAVSKRSSFCIPRRDICCANGYMSLLSSLS